MAAIAQQFTERPLIVKIEQVNGAWDIQPSRTDPVDPANPGGPKHSDIMTQRAAALNNTIDTEWAARRAGGAPTHPHFKTVDDHIPIVVVPGERVVFKSQGNMPFSIWADRDPNVSVVAGSPNNPFGFTLPKTFNTSVSDPPTPITVVNNISGQRFYKCTAYVNTGVETIVVDPDVIGT